MLHQKHIEAFAHKFTHKSLSHEIYRTVKILQSNKNTVFLSSDTKKKETVYQE